MPDISAMEPDLDAQAHSERVVAHIRQEIGRNGGFISLARFIELALYAPSLGYYVAGARKFGAGGDFVTAPELTPLYGSAVARQMENILDASQSDDIFEFGAGSGKLAAAVLASLAARRPSRLRYRILEVSPSLRALQQATLAPFATTANVEWIDRLAPSFAGVALMNEVLDAVPPHVIARRNGTWFERGVMIRDGRLAIDERPLADTSLRALAIARFPADGDYVSELNPAAEALVETTVSSMTRGGLLIIDYGFPRHEYYHADRREGTLVGHFRHRVHADPLRWPGLSDLTSHVDFTAIAEAGERGGARVAGFSSQASFLLGCGILDQLTQRGAPDSNAYLREASAVQKLLSPAEMGDLFKVMLLARNIDCAFLAVNDMTRRL
jgi:SAM-dependent MidA family methyltransferase